MKVIDQPLITRATLVLLALAVALCLAIMVVGARFLLVPESAAVDYGIAAPTDGAAGAYLAVKGVRDVSFGVIGLTLLAVRQVRAAGWVMIAVSIVPFGDAAIVLLHGGSPVLAYAMHGGTGIALLLVGGFLVHNQRALARRGTVTAEWTPRVEPAAPR